MRANRSQSLFKKSNFEQKSEFPTLKDRERMEKKTEKHCKKVDRKLASGSPGWSTSTRLVLKYKNIFKKMVLLS